MKIEKRLFITKEERQFIFDMLDFFEETVETDEIDYIDNFHFLLEKYSNFANMD